MRAELDRLEGKDGEIALVWDAVRATRLTSDEWHREQDRLEPFAVLMSSRSGRA
jgi:hypothetical protein